MYLSRSVLLQINLQYPSIITIFKVFNRKIGMVFCIHTNFIYNRRIKAKKEGDKLSYTTQLLELISKQDGIVLTRDVEAAGIPRHYLTLLAREGLIERASHGIYVTPEKFEDDLYI